MDTNVLINLLKECVSNKRFDRLQAILDLRTRYITVVLEDIFQGHNASAVLRSCDCFGVQDIHLIENSNEFTTNPEVAMGSSKWLSLYKYNKNKNNTLSTIKSLRNKGYRIIATTPHIHNTSLGDLDVSKGKIALLFGTELKGLSDIAIKNADEHVFIPMYGFTESFNISVSAAICLHELTSEIRKKCINWQLEEFEKQKIMLDWLKRSVQSSEMIIKTYIESQK